MYTENLWDIPEYETRTVTAENPTGEKGMGAMTEPIPGHVSERLGKGWKCNPCICIPPHEEYKIADVDGEGIIRHIWMTCDCGQPSNLLPWFKNVQRWRDIIIRIYWDNQNTPSVECPIGDFFACGLGKFAQVSSAVIAVNPGKAFNCYWEMPFKKNFKIVIENLGDVPAGLFYEINYQLRKLPTDICFFHAQFRRTNPTKYKTPHRILDGVKGTGAYVGTYICWGTNSCGWWGEGEVKFYIDGDGEYPTICGTGTEDYFGGSYNFENTETGQYQEYSTLYCGMPQVIRPDGVYHSQQRFGMYRWHLKDAVSFKEDIKVDIQAIGWSTDTKFKCLNDDISSVAFWYQTLPTIPFPSFPSREELDLC